MQLTCVGKVGWTYFMTNKGNITVYTGSSSDLVTRVWRHKNKYYSKSFSGRYNLFKLVHYEFYDSIAEARRGKSS